MSSSPTAWWKNPYLWLGFVLLLTIAVAFIPTSQSNEKPADPANPRPGGARALAEVLKAQGIDVTIVRSQRALLNANLGPDTTVVVSYLPDLGVSTAKQLLEANAEGTTVLIGHGADIATLAPELFDVVGPEVELEPGGGEALTEASAGAELVAAIGSSPVARNQGCSDPITQGIDLDLPLGFLLPLQAKSPQPGDIACQPLGQGHLVLRSGESVWAIAVDNAFLNENIDSGDNAAFALRLLGQNPTLVWYMPNPSDVEAGDTTIGTLPGWLLPSVVIALSAMVAGLLWIGRRLGPLAQEPLPVVVKAIETTHQRGMLYYRVRDRSHAAANLREGSVRRLRRRVAVGRGATPTQLAAALSRHTGRPINDLLDLLEQSTPESDKALVVLAQELKKLEQEVNA